MTFEPIDWTARIRTSLAPQPDADVVEELSQHAAAAYEAARADGHSHQRAAQQVDALIAEWCRNPQTLSRRPKRPPIVEPPAETTGWWSGIVQDARHGLRLLKREPGFALVAILTIALGIGATTTLISVTNGVLLKPLPWAEADRLVRIGETRQGSTRDRRWVTTNGTYLAWRQTPSSVIEDLGAWSARMMTVTGTGTAERLRTAAVSPNIFPLLRAKPALGAVFGPRDEQASVIVLSHTLWRRRFGANPSVLGEVLHLDGEPYAIVGVMPSDFAFPDRETQAWVPMYVPPVVSAGRPGTSVSIFNAVARLRPGATAAQAAIEGTARARNAPPAGLTALAVFGSNGPAELSAVPALDAVTRDVKPALLIFLAAVGLLLATATANVAGLQLARATVRRREIAIRAALGAGAGRITRQLLVENMVLGLSGGAAGLLIAAVLHRALPSLLPADFPRVENIAFDATTAGVALLLGLATSVLFGVWPAVQARRVNLVERLVEGGQAPIGGGQRSRTARARLAIMTGQTAAACVLLIGAALLTRSFVAMLAADRGFNPANVLTARLPLPAFAYTPQRRAELLSGVVQRLRELPGVRHAAFTDMLPLTTGSENLTAFTTPARGGAAGATVSISALRPVVSEDYFAVLGMRIAEGRGFTDRDTEHSPLVLVVNRTFAKRYLDNAAIGTRFANAVGDRREREVVGVVEDVRQQSVTDQVQPMFFVPYRQFGEGVRSSQPMLVARTDGDPRAIIAPLKTFIAERDPSLALESIMTMEDRLSASLARPRLYAALLGLFATFAVAVAATGLFGVLSYSVAQRSREIGVRTALGATPGDIVLMIVRQVAFICGVGTAIGIAVALGAGRLLSTFLYGVGAHDPLSFLFVALALALVAAIAAIVPARRAARIDPITVLREA